MIHRQWLLPGICAAFFTLLLSLTFYQSDFRIVIQRQDGSPPPTTCAPVNSNRSHAQTVIESNHSAQELHQSTTVPPPSDIAELMTVPEYDGITSLPPGDILSAQQREVKTKDGSHSLRLEDNGDVILYRSIHIGMQNKTQLLWSLGTGVVEKDVDYVVRLSKEGVLSVFALFKLENLIDEQLLWHSDMLPGCLTPASVIPTAEQTSALIITSEGEVSIQGRCIMFTPAPESIGRLAVLVSGLYRSNKAVCSSHVNYLVNYPDVTSVEFFVYALYEPGDIHDDITPETIEKGIRDCYGPHLRTLTLKPVEQVSEDWTGGDLPRCGPKINRLQSQLKTLYNGGQDWLDWSAAQGVQHHTVLRIRTDHEFFGDKLPKLKAAVDLKGNELVMQPIAGGWPVPLMSHWFCSNPYGSIDVAISDQMAYGRPTAMHFYLNMYRDFTRIVEMAVKDQNKALTESYLCLTMPSGTKQEECGRVEYCTIECALSWYLQIWSVEVQVNWDWPLRIVRV